MSGTNGIGNVGGIAGQLLNTVAGKPEKKSSGQKLDAGAMPFSPKNTAAMSAASGLPRSDLNMLGRANKGILANASGQMMQGTIMNAAMTNMGTAQNTVNSQIQNQGKMAMGIQDQVNNWMETISASIAKGGKKAQG